MKSSKLILVTASIICFQQVTGSPSEDEESKPDRNKRAYSAYSGPQKEYSAYESFTRYIKPGLYAITRPYYIPIYGSKGRVPIYFPPQLFNRNVGAPPDNPVKESPFQAPWYLPPPVQEKPNITDRLPAIEDETDRPIWDDTPEIPPNQGVHPTRAPRPSSLPEFPPLLHDVSNINVNKLTADQPQAKPLTQRTTAAPARQPLGPNTCAWAVISCCSGISNIVSENCFEQRGCPGPFWDVNPCGSDFAKSTIAEVLKYYS